MKKLNQEREWKVRRKVLRMKKGPFQTGWLWKTLLKAVKKAVKKWPLCGHLQILWEEHFE